MDDSNFGREFMGRQVVSMSSEQLSGQQLVVITSLKRVDQLRSQLLELGTINSMILFPGSSKP
jgi:hypothetical protein